MQKRLPMILAACIQNCEDFIYRKVLEGPKSVEELAALYVREEMRGVYTEILFTNLLIRAELRTKRFSKIGVRYWQDDQLWKRGVRIKLRRDFQPTLSYTNASL